MENNELVPGAHILSEDELREQKEKQLELRMLELELKNQAAEAEEARDNRKRSIISKAHYDLSRGIPVEITSEMRELGIAMEVAVLIQKAEFFYKINQYLMDEDDFEDDDAYLL